MLNKIIQFSIGNKLIIGLFILGLIGYGSYEVTRLPIDAVPDITDNQVLVITISPALGAPDVERLITFPIEQANSNIPGLKEIRSFSRFGLSLVTIVFNDDVDVYWARQQVTERLGQVQGQIPQGLGTPELAPVTTGLGEIYQYMVRPKKGYEKMYTTTELRTIQDWIVRRQLLGTPGVADVSSFGGNLKQYEVSIRPADLQAKGVTIDDVFNALEKGNQNTGGTYIEKGPTVLFIRTEGLVETIEDIQNISIKQLDGGAPLRISDVADVQLATATRYGAMCYNDQGEVAGAIVMMLKGANSSEVIKDVKKRIEQIQKTLPEGVVIEPFLDRTKMVDNAISTVEKNLLEGALIVILVLVLFLGNIRAGLLVASVIPLSMLFAIIMMNTFGLSGNLMSLGALDFGLIVDGAVIIVEAVLHRLTHSKHFAGVQRLDQEQMNQEVNHSASRMMNAAVFGQIIILIVYLPILSLQGIEGKMFKPMALTVAFAIMGAFLLSLTYIPMMSSLVLSKKLDHKATLSDRIMARIERFYQHLLERILNWKKLIVSVAVGLFVISVIIMSNMGGEFIPELEEGDFAVDTRVLTGSNLSTTIDATQKTAKVLLENFPEVEKVVTKIGSGEIPTDPMPIEASDMMVIMKDKSEWKTAQTFDEMAEKMSEKLKDVPGITAGFQYPVQMRFNELMTGARQDVVCKLFGENLDTLAKYAALIGAQVNTVEGAKDLYVESVTGMPQVVIDYKRDQIAKYGLTISDVNRTVNTAFAGQSAGLVFEGERRFDLMVRMPLEARQQVSDIQGLLVATPQGLQIPLSELASVSVIEGPNQIQREDAKRRIVIGFNVRGRDVQSIVTELQEKINTNISFPPAYYITYGGAFENLNAAKNRLAIAVPVALLLIFLMLYMAFKSVLEGLLIYSAIPLAAIGGVFALSMRGMPFSISAGVGFIALFGVAVLNGIVLITEFNRLKAEGMTDMKRVVLMGTKIRLRPVLMTAAVASLGFLPMALSNGAGAEVQRPLATVVIGGLVTATLLTLFVLPILFLMFEGKKAKSIPLTKSLGLITFMIISSGALQAQTKITLDEALTQLQKNNLTLQQMDMRIKAMDALSSIKADIPSLSLNGEYGNINSAATDNRFALSQSFAFPTVYKHERDWNKKQSAISYQEKNAIQLQLIYEVKRLFYLSITTANRIELLQFSDSIYANAQSKSEAQLRAGEASAMEAAVLANQRMQIQQQLKEAEQQYFFHRLQLQQLLQSSDVPVPFSNDAIYPLVAMNYDVSATVPLRIQQLKIAAAESMWKADQARRLPSLSVGYSNMTIKGWQNIDGTDRFYDGQARFSTVSAGVTIPVFSRSLSKKSKASSLFLEEEKIRLKQVQQEEQMRYVQAQESWNLALKNVEAYETTGVLHANLITQQASDKMANGDINYLEWVTLINQTILIRSNRLDAIDQFNQQSFLLETFTPAP